MVMGHKSRVNNIKKRNQNEEAKVIAVQVRAEELRSLADDREEIEGEWCIFDMLPPPMFTGKNFDLWVIRMLTFLRAKGLIEYHCNNPYDEVCDVLALDFIKQGLDEMFF